MKIKKSLKLLSKIVASVAGIAFVSFALGDSSPITLTGIKTNMGHSVSSLAVILQDISLVAGIGFVMASFFKFHQHKLNPTQVPLSQGITLLLIGSGLLLFPVLLPTATKAAFGVSGDNGGISTVTGSGISNLIGGNS